MLRLGDPQPWARHDWPDRRWSPLPAQGHQRSASVLARWRGQAVVLQSFDFGDGPRAFGRADPGDGGQMLLSGSAGAAIALTEDAGNGVQWFQRPDCRPGGWLLSASLSTDWQERVVRLRLLRGPDACPTATDASLTRWRVQSVGYPFLRDGIAGGSFTAQTLVSEHYSHAQRAASDHLERFWMAHGLGMLRWERWETRAGDAASLAASGRCPEVAGSDAPARGWHRVDCRMWTNFIPGPVVVMPWPAATAAGVSR